MGVERNGNRVKVFDSLPGTANQIAIKLQIDNTTVRRWLHDLVKCNEAFIYRYANVKHGGGRDVHYRAGPRPLGFSILKPKNKTAVQRAKKYRDKLRVSGDYEDVKLKRKQQYYLQRSPNVDILTSHFYKGFSNDTP